MNSREFDEIDLIDVAVVLWKVKLTIGLFVVISGVTGALLPTLTTPSYKSEIQFSIDTAPPGFDADKVIADFERQFTRQQNFDRWKAGVAANPLVFDDINAVRIEGGVRFAIPEGERKIVLDKGGRMVEVRSNDIKLISATRAYAMFVGEELANNYASSVAGRIARHKQSLGDVSIEFRSAKGEKILEFQGYLDDIEDGRRPVFLSYPKSPERVSKGPLFWGGVGSMTGLIIGMMVIVASNVVRKVASRIKQLKH